MKTLVKTFAFVLLSIIIFSAGFISCRQSLLDDLLVNKSTVKLTIDKTKLVSFFTRFYDQRYQNLYNNIDSGENKADMLTFFEPRALIQMDADYSLNKKKVEYYYDHVSHDFGKTKLSQVNIDSLLEDGFKYNLSVSVYYANDKQGAARDKYKLIVNQKSKDVFTIDYIYREPDITDPDYLLNTRNENFKFENEDKISSYQHKIMQDNYQNIAGNSNNAARLSASYYAVGAITYAGTFATYRNPSYPVWGNDCTSFISQCLKAGGWIEVGTYSNRTTTSAWFNTATSNYSCYSWSSAQNFYTFCSAHGTRAYGFSPSSFKASDYAVGDIVQIDYDKNGNINHSMIVIKNDGNNVYVAYHEPDSWYQNLAFIFANNKSNSFFYVWHIKGTEGIV